MSKIAPWARAATLQDDILEQTQVLRARLMALVATHLGPDFSRRAADPEVGARMRRMAAALIIAETARARVLEQAERFPEARFAERAAEDCRLFVARLDKLA